MGGFAARSDYFIYSLSGVRQAKSLSHIKLPAHADSFFDGYEKRANQWSSNYFDGSTHNNSLLLDYSRSAFSLRVTPRNRGRAV